MGNNTSYSSENLAALNSITDKLYTSYLKNYNTDIDSDSNLKNHIISYYNPVISKLNKLQLSILLKKYQIKPQSKNKNDIINKINDYMSDKTLVFIKLRKNISKISNSINCTTKSVSNNNNDCIEKINNLQNLLNELFTETKEDVLFKNKHISRLVMKENEITYKRFKKIVSDI